MCPHCSTLCVTDARESHPHLYALAKRRYALPTDQMAPEFSCGACETDWMHTHGRYVFCATDRALLHC